MSKVTCEDVSANSWLRRECVSKSVERAAMLMFRVACGRVSICVSLERESRYYCTGERDSEDVLGAKRLYGAIAL